MLTLSNVLFHIVTTGVCFASLFFLAARKWPQENDIWKRMYESMVRVMLLLPVVGYISATLFLVMASAQVYFYPGTPRPGAIIWFYMILSVLIALTLALKVIIWIRTPVVKKSESATSSPRRNRKAA